jgi:transmembrane sensor
MPVGLRPVVKRGKAMNSPMTDQQRIDQEAAAWVAKLNADTVSGEDRQQFNVWVAQSPAHREAFFAMRQHWQHLGQAAQHSAEPLALPSKTYKPWMMAAASVLLAVTLSLFYPKLQDALLADVVTAVGDHQTLHLEDGSTLHLNTDTAVAFDFSPQQRTIRLLHGEAEVIVAHDPSRPWSSFQATMNPGPWVRILAWPGSEKPAPSPSLKAPSRSASITMSSACSSRGSNCKSATIAHSR